MCWKIFRNCFTNTSAVFLFLFGSFIIVGCQPAASMAVSTMPLTPTAQSLPPAWDDLFIQLCWVAYSPTHFDPTTSPVRYPKEADVREDIRALRQAGFTGMVTYGSNYQNPNKPGQILDITAIAQQEGFNGMVVGVWDPASDVELTSAEQVSENQIVVGYSVGNEGLNERYTLGILQSAMERLRRNTGKPVTTTEQVHDYYENSPLWMISDWIFPNAHPYFSGIREPKESVEWTVKVFNNLARISNKPLIFKEVGLPSDGDVDLSESNQAEYYRLLQNTQAKYVIFEAFDAPWKHLGKPTPDGIYLLPDPEPHWGIFTSERTPKKAAANICPSH